MIHLKEYNDFGPHYNPEGEEIREIINRFSSKIDKNRFDHFVGDSPKSILKRVMENLEYSGDMFRELFPISYQGDIEKRLDYSFRYTRYSTDVAYLYFRIIDFINDCLYEVKWKKI